MPRAMLDTLPSLLEAAARRQPGAPALSWKNARWTYSDLVEAMVATAAFLRGRGRAPGDRVALLFRNSPHYVAAYYGTLSAGGVAVPLNPQEHAEALSRQIQHCQARLLLGDAAHPEWDAIAEVARTRGVEAVGVMA